MEEALWIIAIPNALAFLLFFGFRNYARKKNKDLLAYNILIIANAGQFIFFLLGIFGVFGENHATDSWVMAFESAIIAALLIAIAIFAWAVRKFLIK